MVTTSCTAVQQLKACHWQRQSYEHPQKHHFPTWTYEYHQTHVACLLQYLRSEYNSPVGSSCRILHLTESQLSYRSCLSACLHAAACYSTSTSWHCCLSTTAYCHQPLLQQQQQDGLCDDVLCHNEHTSSMCWQQASQPFIMLTVLAMHSMLQMSSDAYAPQTMNACHSTCTLQMTQAAHRLTGAATAGSK
jgi:hypothetical protein